jgi:hypothetical protein
MKAVDIAKSHPEVNTSEHWEQHSEIFLGVVNALLASGHYTERQWNEVLNENVGDLSEENENLVIMHASSLTAKLQEHIN